MKKVCALLLALVMVFSLVACGAKEEAPAQTPAETPADSPSSPSADAPADNKEHENVVIECYTVKTENLEAWQTLEERFEAAYPWVDIELITLEFSSGSSEFLNSRIAAGNLPDVVQISQGDTYRKLIEEGKIRDLKEFEVSNNIPQVYQDLLTYNDCLFGLAQGAAFATMYYNMEILGQAGWDRVPENWDELIQCLQDIQDKTDAAPIVTSGQHTTLLYFLVDLIVANTCGDALGVGGYEEAFKSGTFDFTAYPEIAEKLAQIAPYFITGAASMVEDDCATTMADGLAGMCLAGNWTAASICNAIAECTGDESLVAASLPPFNEAGKDVWVSVAPEDGFGLTNDPNRSADEQEAIDIFFDWLYQPENFRVIQNSSGSVPVLTTLTEDMIVLPAAIVPVVAPMNAAPSVLMGFNIWTAEYKSAASTALLDLLSGNTTAEEVVNVMWEAEQNYYYYK